MELAEADERTRKTFDTVAAGYDHPGASWFDATARALVRAVQPAPGMQVLDLATGTGKVALALADSQTQAEVLGVDLSSGMLAVAKTNAQALGLRNVTFQLGSFDTLNYGERFDVTVCSFGVFFAEDMAGALARFSAQTRLGGRLFISTFGLGSFAPFNELFLRLYRTYGFETPPPPWLRIATTEGLIHLFQQAGLGAAEVIEHDFSLNLADASAWWDIVYNAGYRGMLQQLTEQQLESFREQHLAEVTDLMEGQGARRLDVRVLIASAVK